MLILKILFIVILVLFGLRTAVRICAHFDVIHVEEPVPFPIKDVIFQIILCVVYFFVFCF